MTFEQFLEAARHLRRDRSGGEPKPYKPLLLASVVVLIHKGEIRTREVYLPGGPRAVAIPSRRSYDVLRWAAA